MEINGLVNNGNTNPDDWNNVIDELAAMRGVNTVDSVADDLQSIVVLCSKAIDKEIFALQAEISLLEELADMHNEKSESEYGKGTGFEYYTWVTKKTANLDSKIQSLQTGLKVLEETTASIGEDAQLANIDLQNALQKQQQTLQTMSNVSKMLHDTAMTVIRKIG